MPRRPTRYYPDHAPELPTSGPDWRWARALELISTKRNASLGRDGPDIIRAISFIRQSLKDVTGARMKRLLKEDPALVLAVQIAIEGGRRQLELHCRVLAGESSGVIAVEMGLAKSIVQTYCLLFFDVAERLDATSFILHRVIGLPLSGPPTDESMMMACAYYHGPMTIKPWLDYLDHQCEAHDLTTAEGRMRESLELLRAAHILDFHAEAPIVLAKRLRLLSETHAKMFRSRSAAEVISENVAGKLGELIWREVENEPSPKTTGRKGMLSTELQLQNGELRKLGDFIRRLCPQKDHNAREMQSVAQRVGRNVV